MRNFGKLGWAFGRLGAGISSYFSQWLSDGGLTDENNILLTDENDVPLSGEV